MKYACPVCKNLVFDDPNGNYNICPICGWEDDPYQYKNPNALGANGNVTLEIARKNYSKASVASITAFSYFWKCLNLFRFKRYRKMKPFRYMEDELKSSAK